MVTTHLFLNLESYPVAPVGLEWAPPSLSALIPDVGHYIQKNVGGFSVQIHQLGTSDGACIGVLWDFVIFGLNHGTDSPFYPGQDESLLLPASELRLEVVSGPRNLKGTNLPMLNFYNLGALVYFLSNYKEKKTAYNGSL